MKPAICCSTNRHEPASSPPIFWQRPRAETKAACFVETRPNSFRSLGQIMNQDFAKNAEWHNVDAALFRSEIFPLNKPAVLRGVIRDWPAVQAGLKSPRALADLLKECDLGRTVETYVADAAI